jgi:hypothetical protein
MGFGTSVPWKVGEGIHLYMYSKEYERVIFSKGSPIR